MTIAEARVDGTKRFSEIIAAEEPRRLSWRTIPSGPYPDSVQWQIDLVPDSGRTRVRESFAVLVMPRLMEWLLWAAEGSGVQKRVATTISNASAVHSTSILRLESSLLSS